MIKNNILAFIIHLLIALPAFFLGQDIAAELIMESAALSAVIGFLISCIYIFAAYKLMRPTKSVFTDFLSVSSVLVIGIIIWGTVFSGTTDVYYGYTFPFLMMTVPVLDWLTKLYYRGKDIIYLMNIYLAVLPSLFLWIGILLKRKKQLIKE